MPTERDFLRDGREADDFSELEEGMVQVMRTIYDPEIPVPIWDLGLIYGWTITDAAETEGKDVTVTMTLTAPNCPAAETLPAEVEQGVNALEGVAHAKIDLVFVPSYSMEMLSDEARLTLGFM
jgi:metal-sulfur cluster biosynthetic enzyme